MPDPEEDAVTRPELLVLTGMHAPGVEGVISRIRTLDPDTAVLHHDLRDIESGRVPRRPRRGRLDETTVLELEHGCLSCTLREDLLPQLLELAGPGGPRWSSSTSTRRSNRSRSAGRWCTCSSTARRSPTTSTCVAS
jgi:hypothetical protein